ncbi:MAG TPA: agmatine deiminase family protein [Saprospiraceae bacterium]|nr:agmatine deiminase family protein [Saprospiraceae bacterium]
MKNNIIFPAEWHPQTAVGLTFPHSGSDWASVLEQVTPVFVEMVRLISRYEQVIVVCDSIERVRNLLSDIDLSQIHLYEVESNDTWCRDFMPITILEDNKPKLINYFFNGWGLKFRADKDNVISERLWSDGVFGNLPMHYGGITLEGGALESNGEGTLLSTTQCLLSRNRNPHLSIEETEEILRRQLGINHFLWLNQGYLAGDDTDSHIDTLARFCTPELITYVQCNDEQDEHYAALRQMEAQLHQFKTAEGKPFDLVPLPMAPPRYDDEGQRLPATYANFLIINGAVLVPTYEDEQLDNEALTILGRCFPDRIIHGVNCIELIKQYGSLHCITMQFPEEIIFQKHQQ